MSRKKKLTLVLSLLLLSVAAVLLVGCSPTETPEHTHSYVVEDTVAPTCGVAGTTRYRCTSCEDEYTETVPATGEHVYPNEPDSSTLPTCEESGSAVFTCTSCGKSNETVIDATGHTSADYAEVTPTCTALGYTGGTYCTVCEKVLTQRTELPATGEHTEASFPDVAPTCGTVGYTGGTYCTVCEGVLTPRTELPVTGTHTAAEYETVKATCTAVGYTGGSYCTVCENVLTPRTELPLTDHAYTSVITVRPVYGTEGEKKNTCSVCGHSVTEKIAALTYRPEDVWDGTTASAYAGGDGSKSDPYQIADPAQLMYFASQVKSGEKYNQKYFVLTADIILNDLVDFESWSKTNAPKNQWAPIEGFAGTFDGKGHSIRGAYCHIAKKPTSGSSIYVYAAALFNNISSATVQNLKLTESYFVSEYGIAGGLCGYVDPSDSSVKIANVTFSGHVASGANYAGGIIAYARLGWHNYKTNHDAYLSVSACQVSGSVSSYNMSAKKNEDTAVGGIIGYAPYDGATLRITSCANYAKISSLGTAGGIIGSLHLSASGGRGSTYLTLQEIANHGEVFGHSFTGGIGGFLSTSSNTPSLSVSYLANDGAISSHAHVGGLFGYFSVQSETETSFKKSYNAGDVTGLVEKDCYAGGLFGYFYTDSYGSYSYAVLTNFNLGNVTGKNAAGGYAGYAFGAVGAVQFYNKGSITGDLAGGIFGQGSADILNCYNEGTVKGTTAAGGLAGKISDARVQYSYTVGKVSGSAFYVGAIAGNRDTSSVSFTGVIYLADCATDGAGNLQGMCGQNKLDSVSNRGGVSQEKLKDQKNFTGFDFKNIWNAPSEDSPAPTLKNMTKEPKKEKLK